jgi:dolichyl-phosphate beta-glucosyltransferase
MVSISIVIPTYNESRRIPGTINAVNDFLKKKKANYEIIVVDDGSNDDTLKAVRAIKATRVKTLSNRENRGKGHSIKRGVFAASKQWILATDADLSTPIEELEQFLSHSDHDVLIGSRALTESNVQVRQPLYRDYGGKLFNVFVQAVTLPGIKDTQCGFKLFRADAARKIFAHHTIEGFGFDVEALYLARKFGLRVKELPVAWRNDPETKVNLFKDPFAMFADALRVRLNDVRGVYDAVPADGINA